MISLQEMTEPDFAGFRPLMVEEYARDIANNYRITMDEARLQSTKQIAGFLSQGLATPNHTLFNIVKVEDHGQESVGYLWVEVDEQQRRCFIFDIYLHEAFRGRGFGKQTLLLLEDKMREKKIARIGLHVFAHNTTAFELYKKIGYELTGHNMQKWLVD